MEFSKIHVVGLPSYSRLYSLSLLFGLVQVWPPDQPPEAQAILKVNCTRSTKAQSMP